MIDKEALANLIQTQRQADAIRRRFAIWDPHAVLFLAPLDQSDEELFVVEADGFGASLVRIVEGNYPIDFLVLDERKFDSETEGIRAAESLVDGSGDAQEMLLEYSR